MLRMPEQAVCSVIKLPQDENNKDIVTLKIMMSTKFCQLFILQLTGSLRIFDYDLKTVGRHDPNPDQPEAYGITELELNVMHELESFVRRIFTIFVNELMPLIENTVKRKPSRFGHSVHDHLDFLQNTLIHTAIFNADYLTSRPKSDPIEPVHTDSIDDNDNETPHMSDFPTRKEINAMDEAMTSLPPDKGTNPGNNDE